MFKASSALTLIGFAGCLACSGARYGGPNDSAGVTVPNSVLAGSDQAEKTRPEAPGEAPSAGVQNRASASAGNGQRAPRQAAEVDASQLRRKRYGSLPDPDPISARQHWVYEFFYDGGDVKLLRTEKRVFDQPEPSPRRMGRFALELWLGGELLERVRFDFPLLGNGPAGKANKHPLHEPPSFEPGIKAKQTVTIAHSERATRAVLVDRRTGEAIQFAFPPRAP